MVLKQFWPFIIIVIRIHRQLQLLWNLNMDYQRSTARQTSNARVLQNITNKIKIKNSHKAEINNTQAQLFENLEQQNLSRFTSPLKNIESDYQPASFSKAVEYKLKRSYYVKNPNGYYRKIQLLEDTKTLKYFGLGPYFYVQFMRRICWMFFFFSIIEGIRIYINSKSSGLSDYSVSFSTYLIPTTLGNFNKNAVSSYDAYIVALAPVLILLILLGFYLCWKCHFYSEIQKQDQSTSNIKPEKFCFKVVSADDKKQMNEENLRKIFENFGPIHEISIIRRHTNKLEYFEQLQKIQQCIRQYELELTLGEGNPQELQQYKQDKRILMNEIKHISIQSEVKSAYIHFQYEKSKVQCLSYFNKHYLFQTCCHGFARNCCCCCLPDLPKKLKLNGKHDILIKEQQVPAPEDINWQSNQLGSGSKMSRYLFAFFIICLFLALSCTIIGICTIYISTHSSNCDSVTIPQSLTAAQAVANDSNTKICYCNANLLASLTDSAIKSFCRSELESLYIEQGVQYIIILASSITNFLFGLIVDRIINCTRPASQSQSLKIKTLVYTLFLIFNTIFLPILLYSDIFGFKSSSYFSFISLISSGLSSFLQINNLQFYLDYNPIWYRSVSPMFTNFMVFDLLMVWIMFVISKFRASYINLSNQEHKILQKHMNEQIITYQFSPYKEYSTFIMILFMSIFLSPGIPVLIPLALVNLLSRYITNRELIQKDSTRVDGLGIIFNQLPQTLLPILLILASLNGCWMLTANNQIYPNTLPFNINVWDINNWFIMKRELYLPFYFFIALFVVGQYIFYHTIIRFCSCISNSCFQRKRTIHPSQTKTFTEHKKGLNILTSYNIKSNDKMRNAVTRMEAYIKKNTNK